MSPINGDVLEITHSAYFTSLSRSLISYIPPGCGSVSVYYL